MIDILPVINSSVLFLIGAIVAIYVSRKRHHDEEQPSGWLLVLTACMWGFAVVCIGHVLFFAPRNDWNGVLMTPSLAILKGINIHAQPGEGPLIPSTYGPIFFLIFMPSCIVFDSPTWIIISGALVNFLVGFVPIVFMLQRTARLNPRRWGIITLSGLILLVILQRPSLSSAYFNIHCDTPAIGAAFAACLFVLPREKNLKRSLLFWSALFCTLSVWSKQTMLVLTLSVSIYLLMGYGWKSLGRFLTYFLVINTVVAAICVWVFGLQNLWFHMIELVQNQPWYTPDLRSNPWLHQYDLRIEHRQIAETLGLQLASLAVAGFILLRDNLLWVSALVLGVAVDIRFIKSRQRDWFGEIKRRNWFPFVLTMFLMIPASILPLVKVGGYVNNKAFFEIFLIVSVIMIWADITLRSEGITQPAFIGVFITLMLLVNTPRIVYAFGHTELRNDNSQEIVFQFEKEYRGAAYFPWHPLPVLLAENKLYHFDYTALDLFYTGQLLPKKIFLQDVPRRHKFVAYHRSNGTRFILQRYFPDYTEYNGIKSLPGFTVLGPVRKTGSSQESSEES